MDPSATPESEPPPNYPSEKTCRGCGRHLYLDVDGVYRLAESPVPHDEEECAEAHGHPIVATPAVGPPKKLDGRRKGERRTAWRARSGLL